MSQLMSEEDEILETKKREIKKREEELNYLKYREKLLIQEAYENKVIIEQNLDTYFKRNLLRKYQCINEVLEDYKPVNYYDTSNIYLLHSNSILKDLKYYLRMNKPIYSYFALKDSTIFEIMKESRVNNLILSNEGSKMVLRVIKEFKDLKILVLHREVISEEDLLDIFDSLANNDNIKVLSIGFNIETKENYSQFMKMLKKNHSLRVIYLFSKYLTSDDYHIIQKELLELERIEYFEIRTYLKDPHSDINLKYSFYNLKRFVRVFRKIESDIQFHFSSINSKFYF